jgi:hypothetical protein
VGLQGLGGVPPGSVLLPVAAAMAPLPQRLGGLGRGVPKRCSGERLGCELSRVGKKVRGG